MVFLLLQVRMQRKILWSEQEPRFSRISESPCKLLVKSAMIVGPVFPVQAYYGMVSGSWDETAIRNPSGGFGSPLRLFVAAQDHNYL